MMKLNLQNCGSVVAAKHPPKFFSLLIFEPLILMKREIRPKFTFPEPQVTKSQIWLSFLGCDPMTL